MSKRVLRELLCIDCGKYFMGKAANYCPECANKRRALGNRQWKSDLNKLKQDDIASSKRLMEYALRASRAEKEQQAQICPNRDRRKVSCAMCTDGAWKFKDCGKAK